MRIATAAPNTTRPPKRDEPVMEAGLSPVFTRWLQASTYRRCDFVRSDVPGGSFGGALPGQKLARPPVIFVHGNCDSALGSNPSQRFTGWTPTLRHFLARGYRACELYGTTWGTPGDLAHALTQSHSKAHVMQIRGFIEAVLAHTGSPVVDIVSHSMGVTLARQAILGGEAADVDGSKYFVGAPLGARVRTFVGIAGANMGLGAALHPFAMQSPATDSSTGFFPGLWTPFGITGVSAFLANLNRQAGYEGKRRYTVWSRADELVGASIHNQYTARIPGQTGEHVVDDLDHFASKDQTTDIQYRWLAAR